MAEGAPLKKALAAAAVLLALCACRAPQSHVYTIGYLQLLDSPTNADVRRGFRRAIEDGGLKDGVNVRLREVNGQGDIAAVQKLAQTLVAERVDLIVAVSTQSLQAATMATQTIPIVFASVANPYLTRAGLSPSEHLPNVTGIASTAPVREGLALIREILPLARRVGTLWSPSERNSEYYLELARAAAADLGFEIVAVPVANPSEILLSAQVLVTKKIDVLYPISDNTINASFEAIGKVADENGLPLIGGFLLSTRSGASAAVGWDFEEMGYRSGLLAVRVKNGESPAGIPFQAMSDAKLQINLEAASRQKIAFPPAVLKRAAGPGD
jgi:putative tryptophan/tyrosine transport system substrate-binding protein